MTGLGAVITNPHTLISTFGLLGLLAVVFIETGLLVGLFLPGDSLLFTAGVLAAQTHPVVPLWILLLTVPVAAVAGDQCGFLIGTQAGHTVFDRPRANRLGPDRLARAQAFFTTSGASAVLWARFVPVARTLTPAIAGTSRMPYRTFVGYNVVGALAWGAGVPTAGYLFGGIGFVAAHIGAMLIAVAVVSVLPLLLGYNRTRLRRRPADQPTTGTPLEGTSPLALCRSHCQGLVSTPEVNRQDHHGPLQLRYGHSQTTLVGITLAAPIARPTSGVWAE
jgi:membrane-associated protein